jgi:hypothetical protein
MRNSSLHPGISVHHIQVGGGIAGLIFTVGSVVVFLLGIPALWYFLGCAIALGAGIAVVLRMLRRGNSN